MYKKELTLLLLLLMIYFQRCNDINTADNMTKNDLNGIWAEIDTSAGSESWEFKDSIVIHRFKNSDTIGYYHTWEMNRDTLNLTDERGINLSIFYSKENFNELNFVYYRWDVLVNKRFRKQ